MWEHPLEFFQIYINKSFESAIISRSKTQINGNV